MPEAPEPFSDLLKRLTQEAGISIVGLARRTGLSRQMLYYLLQGKSGPSWKSVLLLADALGLSTDAFRALSGPEQASGQKPHRKPWGGDNGAAMLDDSEHFASRLRQLREAAGLTPTALAKKAGLSGGRVVVDLEMGKEPRWTTVVRLADALRVSTEAFRTPAPAVEGEPSGQKPKHRARRKDGHA